MRVALVTETFPPEVNGVARTLEQVALGLTGRGHSLQVVRPRQRREAPLPGLGELLVPGAPIPGYTALRFGLPARRRLLRAWRRRRPDVVHVATEGPLGLSALSAARRLGLPVSSSFHTNFHQYGRFYGYGLLRRQALAYLRWFHNRTSLTLVPVHGMVDLLATQGFHNLEIMGRGVDTALFSPARRSRALRRSWGAGDGDLVAVYVGRLAAEKSPDLAVRAFVAMAARRPGCRLVLVGDGPAAGALRRRHPEAHFAGLRLGEDLAAHYASADVQLFPSLTETFGNVVLEGMASGLAVVGFDYAAMREHVRHGENGLAVPFEDEAAFIEAAAAATDPGRARSLGRAARSTAESLTWAAIVERLEAQLQRVAATATAEARPGRSPAASGRGGSRPG